MDNRVSGQLRDIISKNNNIGIALGKNPSVDAMASALSLYLALKAEGKNVSVVCPTNVLVEHSNLVGVDKVKTGFEDNSGDMTVSFPYEEGEIDKISYTLENGSLNIIVKAGENRLSFNEKDVQFKRSQGYPSLLFVIGTSRLSDLERIYDPTALKDTTVVNIDNKPDNQGFGDVSIVSPSSSSISEKVADIMLSLGLNVDIDAAQNLLIGIENATGNFQDVKAAPLAFEITAELIRKGAVRSSGVGMRAQAEAGFDNFSDEDEEAFFEPNRPAGQAFRPMSRQSMSQSFNRQQNAGADLQRLAQMQNRQRGQVPSSDRQDLTPERKEPATGSTDSLRQDSGQAGQGRKGKKPPVDWLTPKIYKGSTNI